MINSLLLYFSCYRTKRYLNFLFFAVWFVNYMIVKRDYLSQLFTYINLAVFLVIMNICLIKKTNKYLAPFSVLLYSVVIDIICYYYFPLFNVDISLFAYIMNGIIFNFKFVIIPVIITLVIELYNFIKEKRKKKVVRFNNFMKARKSF